MNRNTKYLLRIWIVTLAVVGPMVAFLTVSAMIALGPTHWWPYTVLFTLPVLFVGAMRLNKWIGDRRVRRLLRSESPEALVGLYAWTVWHALIPDADAIMAHGRAFSYILYGEFDAARSALRDIDWERRVPLICAQKHALGALLCYLEAGQYETGLEFARAAREMARVSPAFPGARMSADAYASYVEIGEILCGDITEEKIASLERKHRTLPTLSRLLIAWGLAAAYHKRGDHAKAESERRFIRDVAPHCRAITAPPVE